MADNNTNQNTQSSSSSSVGFFKTLTYGLKVVVGNPKSGEVAPETVDFVAYDEKYQGDLRKVGYLMTDNAKAIKILKKDVNVEEISEEEYENATDPEKGAVKAAV